MSVARASVPGMRDGRRGSARRGTIAIAATLGVLGATAVPAFADETIRAGFPNRFTTPTPSMDQGEPLFFQNLDTNRHDVTATAKDPTDPSKPLFASATIGPNETVPVAGAQYLTAGSYDFICSVHPFMEGTLTVTSAGTPVPRPGGGGGGATDATAPTVRVRITSTKLRTVVRSGKLKVRVSSNESSAVNISARTRLRGRNVTIARGTATVSATTRTVSLKLTSSARRALRRARRASISVTARATDAAGNAARARASRRLSR